MRVVQVLQAIYQFRDNTASCYHDRLGRIRFMAKTVLDTVSEDDLLEQAGERTEQRSGLQSAADLAAERAAFAAEAAAQAAQRAAGLMERIGAWVGLTINRAAQQEPTLPAAAVTPMAERAVPMRRRAAMAAPVAEVSSPENGGIIGRLKQQALSVGERISDWSDGRYGLKPQEPDKQVAKAQKKRNKQRERRAKQAAKEAAKRSNVSWFPWMIGMSIGLVVGLVGVAYWQRQRLQRLWGETSQRVQQATDMMRQRIEASRSPGQQTLPRDIPPAPSNFTSLGSTPTVTDIDRPANGRLESTSQ
jgi:hypothetical protein